MSPLRHLQGWSLLRTSLLIIAAVAVAILWRSDFSVDGVRMVLRTTARTSLALFLLAFTASAAFRLWPSTFTRWQRANRRYLGLSFAGSHAIHALAIMAYAFMDPVLFHSRIPPSTHVISGLGYVFILAMAVTSFRRTAAWLGARAWKALHLAASYYLWLSFMNSFGKRAASDPFYWPFAGLVVAALLIRIVGKTPGLAADPASDELPRARSRTPAPTLL
ncbi:hypothetical protein WMF28_25735 [Sorangium sp. So ce590]|uniref:hypothetical protein n=1 Tax=Sorangium sp. So ce590 TaxID=3133317 RepID=UPI003F6476CE